MESKGARKSIEFLLRFGAPQGLIQFNDTYL
jgi:hypothetical protein